MEYKIDNKSLSSMGVIAGRVNSTDRGFPLTGIFNLPKRLGASYRDWQGEIEPYVETDDMCFMGRDLELKVVCMAQNSVQLNAKIRVFRSELSDSFILSHPLLGSYDVGLTSVAVKSYLGKWAELTLSMKESEPLLGCELPTADGGEYGVDGYSWEQLGFVVSDMSGMEGIGAWKKLSVTTNPYSDSFGVGYRGAKTATITGTILGANYAEFEGKVKMLQALFMAPGIRTVRVFGGEEIEGFAVNGFTITNLHNLMPKQWATFTCQIITL